MATRSLPSFLLLVAAWLVLTFFVWWLATPLLAWPVAVLCHIVTRIGFSDLVQSIEQSAEMITFVTTLRAPGTLAGMRIRCAGSRSVTRPCCRCKPSA
jgi:hypothetical protein